MAGTAHKQRLGPSVKALTQFPSVLAEYEPERDLQEGNSQSSDAAALKQQKRRLDALRVRFDT